LLTAVYISLQKIDAMGKMADELMARTHELLQPNPGMKSFL